MSGYGHSARTPSTAATARWCRRSAGSPTSAACPARSRRAGACRTWTTRPRTTTRRRCCWRSTGASDRQGHRDRRVGRSRPASTSSGRCCSTSPSTATRPAARTSRPATGSSGPTPRRTASTRRAVTTIGSPSPCSTTHQWAGLVEALGTPSWTDDARFATQEDRLRATRTSSTSTWRRGRATATATTSWSCCRPHGVPAGAVQNAEDLNERDPQIAAPRRVLRDGPPGHRPGPVRGHPDPFSETHVRTTGARRRCSARTTRTCSRTSSASTTTSSTS